MAPSRRWFAVPLLGVAVILACEFTWDVRVTCTCAGDAVQCAVVNTVLGLDVTSHVAAAHVTGATVYHEGHAYLLKLDTADGRGVYLAQNIDVDDGPRFGLAVGALADGEGATVDGHGLRNVPAWAFFLFVEAMCLGGAVSVLLGGRTARVR